VWQARVPQKLRVFAWRAATSTLDVREGLRRRITKTDLTCTICGAAVEDDHHALITCTLSTALRDGMRQYWDLRKEEAFRYKGPEWLLSLLSNSSQKVRARIIFLLWQAWHHRNNIVHEYGKASVSASIPYMRNYLESFNVATYATSDPNGKSPVMLDTHKFFCGSFGEMSLDSSRGWMLQRQR
jgi:hypothetical protein